MKSYVAFVQSLYDGILSDIGVKYPGLRVELERDFKRLCSAIESDGLSFVTIVLPDAGKHFDKCLSASLLTRFCLPHMRSATRGGVIPRLFGALLLRVFDSNGVLRDDLDIHAVRCLRQVYYLMKKIELECDNARTFGTIREFFQVDRECRRPTLQWDSDFIEWDQVSRLGLLDLYDRGASHSDLQYSLPLPLEEEEDTVDTPSSALSLISTTQQVADMVSALIGVFNPYEWRTKHGPGAVSDAKIGTSKYEFPTWPQKLDNVFPLADFGFANYALWADFVTEDNSYRFTRDEKPSKLIAVPKTQKAPRLIASEPIAHQWCQQSILDFLQSRVAATFISRSIHFRDQTFNQKAALEASHMDDRMTIDLSSASDRISCWLVERVFRRNKSLLTALHATRTRWVVNSIDKKSPHAYILRKFSCMGSACTFPVQSIIFYIVAVASVLSARKLPATYRNIGAVSREVLVFGDDIIIPKDSGECLALLSYLGLKVNHNKTFGKGRFRESCGCDAFDGHDVTPVYIRARPDKARPGSIISSVEVYNNLERERWYRAASVMKTTVMTAMPHLRLPSLPVDSGYFGWRSPDWDVVEDPCKRRFNTHLHREEILVHAVKSDVARLPDRSGSRVLQYFTEAPPPDLEWVSGIPLKARPRLRLRWVPLQF